MTFRRGLRWLALVTLLGSGCDKTLSFDAPVDAENGGEHGSGGSAGTGSIGSGGLVGDAGGPDEPWLRAGGPGKDPPPATGGTDGFLGNEDCQSFCSSLGQRCLEVAQRCVECEEYDDCAPLGLYCDRTVNRCVSCVGNNGCGGGKECDDSSRQCLESCLTQEHPERDCHDAPQMCDEGRHVCVSCRGDDDCVNSPDGPHCLQGGARCAECAGDGDCRQGAPHCDPVLFRCVECADSRDCDPPNVCHLEAHVCGDPRLPWPFPEAP